MARPEGRLSAGSTGKRLLGIGAAGLFIAAALGSGLDRMTEGHPSLAPYIPSIFRSGADSAQARQVLATDPAQAVAFARAALASDPSDIYAGGLLGSALVAQGDGESAYEAYRLSAAKGWRDGVAQAFWFDDAIARGDYPQAALRLDALMRQSDAVEAFQPLTDLMEDAGTPRSALVARMKDGPPWLDYYAAPRVELAKPDLVRRGQVLAALGIAGGKLGCSRIRKLAGLLVDAEEPALARQLWTLHCEPIRQKGLLTDPDFEGLGDLADQASPFGWRRHPSGDVEIRVERDGERGHALLVRNRASARRLVLDQPVNLPAGRYVVTALVTRSGQVTTGAIDAGLGCGTYPQPPAARDGDIAQGGQVLTAPQSCAAQRFSLWLRPGGDAVRLSGTSLRRLD